MADELTQPIEELIHLRLKAKLSTALARLLKDILDGTSPDEAAVAYQASLDEVHREALEILAVVQPFAVAEETGDIQ